MGRDKHAAIVLIVLAAACGQTAAAPPLQTFPSPLQPGEKCDSNNTAPVLIHYDPPQLILAPNQTRSVRAVVEPDLCSPAQLSFSAADPATASAPPSAILDLRHPFYEFTVTGGAAAGGSGTIPTRMTTITGSLTLGVTPTTGGPQVSGDGGPAVSAPLTVIVRDGTPPTCNAGESQATAISAAQTTANGVGKLGQSSLSVPPGAFTRTDELALPPFTGTVACDGEDLSAGTGLEILGPSVTFAASAPISMAHSLRRELDFAIPVNPAAIPAAGRMRHLVVLFRSPGGMGIARTPRVITIASPRIEQVPNADAYVLRFSSPWFGTYQAAMAPDAGTLHRKRHLTHRAVIGFSMGAGGASSFGLRHHDQFDVIAPMGGPSDWNWLLWYVEHYALAGFCPATDPSYPSCPAVAPNAYPLNETYALTMDWDHWWYETGNGNGGTFPRSEYTQIFADLALMEGDPNGHNPDPSLSFFPAGPTVKDANGAPVPWVVGNTTGLPSGIDCRVTVDPITDPVSGNPDPTQQMWQQQCNASRCDPRNAWVAASGYFDREYNPDGSKQIISFCDGGQNGTSPYIDTWAPPQQGQAFPVNVVLAVDLNKNGVRDGNEPILRQGHEPWDDTGTDGLFDPAEPGYDAVSNPDPNQDDYDFQLNPNGAEGDHHYELGEPFLDYGLDGVKGTAQQGGGPNAYDWGEGDGVYTLSSGLQNFYAVDGHNILHQWVTKLPAGPMTDDELLRFDIWSDGGVRDLFNFAAVGNHLEGSIASRHSTGGAQLRSTAFYNGFEYLPGQDPLHPENFAPGQTLWADVVDSPNVRYGTVDATPSMIALGDGQHVGTASQLLYRLTSSLYFAAQHWPDADRTLTELTAADPETSSVNTLGTNCEISGKCETVFTGPNTKRSGPVVVQLPPGYALAENVQRNMRYPVVYVLHGYGQNPQDLEAVAIVSTNFMNDELKSSATRLPKFILVYVDGRCRLASDGTPECIRGTFYLNSDRTDTMGNPIAQIDSWFDELVNYVDANYRTMGGSDVDVVE
jgi:hypothetical protein